MEIHVGNLLNYEQNCKVWKNFVFAVQKILEDNVIL